MAERRRRTGRQRTSPAEIRAATREKQVLELRLSGMSLQQIADEVGYASRGAVHAAITRALARWGAEDAEQLRAIELARLDKMTQELWQRIEYGDLGAMDLYIKISDRRARLAGLDAPKQTKIDVKSDTKVAVAVAAVDDVARFQQLAVEVARDMAERAIESGQGVEVLSVEPDTQPDAA